MLSTCRSQSALEIVVKQLPKRHGQSPKNLLASKRTEPSGDDVDHSTEDDDDLPRRVADRAACAVMRASACGVGINIGDDKVMRLRILPLTCIGTRRYQPQQGRAVGQLMVPVGVAQFLPQFLGGMRHKRANIAIMARPCRPGIRALLNGW